MKGEPVQIYKQKREQRIISVLNDFSNNYMCVQPAQDFFNWELREDLDSVLGYTCQKATIIYYGRTYEAWFTTAIPIQDGPWKFCGLPGIIMKVVEKEGNFSWEAIGIETFENETFVCIDNVDYESCSLENFGDAAKDYRTEVGASVIYDGMVYTFTVSPYVYNTIEKIDD